ncbi:Serine aminopeptidase [Giardia muris]|uniref:Serine aminopeptidase n=1 Tax=Giardia muris TaxID=5742 RepID=A0A4Z1SQ06_GIAMU|nr:Serine aminopeptidase [Giardia muris]|eukprot:TNJ27896.1 Serine aminopeptidase [Giardia muris]
MGCIVDTIAYPSNVSHANYSAMYGQSLVKIQIRRSLSVYGALLEPDPTREYKWVISGFEDEMREIRERVGSLAAGTKVLMLYSHGNGETLDCLKEYLLDMAAALTIPVFAYDYEGYGMSGGSSGEKHARRDVEKVYAYLRRTYPEHRLVLAGRSIGSVTTAHMLHLLTHKRRYRDDLLKGVVLGAIIQSGLASALNIVCVPRCNTQCDCLKNFDKFTSCPIPILFLHGLYDSLVPSRNSLLLADYYIKANSPRCYKEYHQFIRRVNFTVVSDGLGVLIRVERCTLILVGGADHNNFDALAPDYVYGSIFDFIVNNGNVQGTGYGRFIQTYNNGAASAIDSDRQALMRAVL